MAEDTVERPAEPAPTHTTTIIHERRSSGGTGSVIAVILLVAVLGGLYLFSERSGENARDAAITEAANDIGKAATKVGDAAQEAVKGEK